MGASEYIEVMNDALSETWRESAGMLSLFMVLEVLIFSSLMYAIENEENDKISSVPSAMWLVFITMCTVGYGDVYPETNLGRICGVALVYTGFVVMSIIIVIIGGNFDKHYKIFTKKRMRFKKLMLIMQYKEQGIDVKGLLAESGPVAEPVVGAPPAI